MTAIYEDVLRGARQWLTHVPEPVYIEDLEGRVLWGNPAYEELAAQSGRLAAARNRVPVARDDGRTIAYAVYAKPEADPRAEVYRIVAEHTSDTIVLVDREAYVRYVSPSFETLSGYNIEQYEGIGAFDIIHKDDREQVNGVFRSVLESKTEAETEYRVMRANGGIVYAEARVKPVLDREGEVRYVVAVVRDVSERKEAERQLDNILENVGAGVWSTDRDFTRHTFMSKSMEKLCGLPREEVMNRPMRMHDHIHPDDNEHMIRVLKPKLDRGIPADIPIRFIHVEGETRWARMIVTPVLDRHGETVRLDSIVVDITEQKRSELALEESRQRYKSLFENNLDGVFSIELDGYYLVNANPAFEAITGIEKSRLANRCFLGVVYDEDHADVYDALQRVRQEGRPRDIECRLAPGKDGQRIVQITFVPILLHGSLNGIHGIAKDITKRKREERELVESEKRYKALQQSLNRFSNDLANVMKVSDLERRLIDEVRDVLNAARATIEEVPSGEEASRTTSEDVWIRIGEKRHPVYLRIGLGHELLPIEREWLETAVRYVTILYDNLHLIEDLMKRMEELALDREAPRWMLRLLFKLSEKERATLSSDLHDSVLQDLIIWYRKLESLRSLRTFEPEAMRELMRIEEGLLDAIHQIRITCNELRPPFLLKMGLVESLKSLFEYTRMFANYEIEFTAAEASAVSYGEEHILGVYRIVQELLNNANKHSRATKIGISLTEGEDGLVFAYADDGVGMEWTSYEDSFQHMGLAGIEKRVLSLGGRVAFRSAPREGFHVDIRFPKS
ncbi:PAS domain S-box protein [Paenibacillus antri]|uniref:histidine kinase n=1 Tax=Paenibacillus antri TaxID=2582848 RepID=A0A5R9G7A4_9BACL|nr:PAS domain S-box protein [Paenibacillus antri]TLS51591.1 PAS domain S-box protein [Paenibacillus antri]